MTVGNTITDSLQDSLPTVIAGARSVRENEGVMAMAVEHQTLGEGLGLDWNEITLDQIEAQAVTETTKLDNPQQLSDSIFTITPTIVGIHTVITDRVARRIDKKALAQTGALAQNAVQRKKNADGLTVLDGATTSLCGAGTTLTIGHITAGVSQITSNATEPGKLPINCVLHGYQLQDIWAEIVAGVGTYNIPDGMTARALTDGFRGNLANARLLEDGNITIDSADDAKGGVFAMDAIVLVQGMAPRAEVKRLPDVGGGATAMYYYDEYAYGERSAGNWMYELYSDATAPTS